MNKLKKLFKPFLLIIGITCACLAFAGCGQPDEEWNHSAGNWKETDGVYFGLVCKDDAPEGEIKADKVDADLAVQLNKKYYFIIDFVLQAAENNSGWEKLTVSVKLNAESVLASDLQETSSSDYTNNLNGDEREIAVTYIVPDYAETQIKKRIVLDLTPQEYGEAEAKISFTSGTELAGLPDSVTYNLDVRYTQNLRYEENEQGGYTVYKGEATDENVIIPYRINGKYVTEIGNEAFYGYKSLKSITIPDSVTNIADRAFLNCRELKTAILGNDIKSIGVSAFSSCSSLTKITVGNKLEKICVEAFYSCSNLTEIIIPDSVTDIDYYAFSHCNSLTSVNIGKSVKSIGLGAFNDCSELTSVTLPDGVTNIGEYAFKDCNKLVYNEYENALYLGSESNKYLFLIKAKNTGIYSCRINPDTKNIANFAFQSCGSLSEITIEKNITYIPFGTFTACRELSSVTILNEAIEIGVQAFHYCEKLTDITFNGSVTRIGDYAFGNCSNLTNITFNGTKEQWKAISKGYYWYNSTGNYSVHCTDGDLSKEES